MAPSTEAPPQRKIADFVLQEVLEKVNELIVIHTTTLDPKIREDAKDQIITLLQLAAAKASLEL